MQSTTDILMSIVMASLITVFAKEMFEYINGVIRSRTMWIGRGFIIVVIMYSKIMFNDKIGVSRAVNRRMTCKTKEK